MKEYIVLSVVDKVIFFDFRTINKEENIFLNKNSFNNDSLYYNLRYFRKNISKIIDLIKNKYIDINEIKVRRLVTFKYVAEFIKEINIPVLTLNFLSTIDTLDYDLFLDCQSLKVINCYFMASDYKNKFVNKGIIVNTSIINKITDKFMIMQDASIKDNLYYSKVVNIKEDYPELLIDLDEFLKINYKLKAINIYIYSKELISKIVELVSKDESKNVIIYLHQETDKGNFIINNFSWLKEISKKYKDEYTCEFRIVYANSFLSNNLFKQLTFNNLKLISILCMYVCFVFLLIYKSYNYIEKLSVDKLNAGLSEININNKNDEINNENANESDNIELNNNDSNNNSENNGVINKNESIKKEEKPNIYNFENSISKLRKINNETVGFISIPNTNIAYPVVQHSDNNYYLIRDFYKKKSSLGWIYLDYRNNINNILDNTIIYGHNMSNGMMFGTLKNVLNKSFRSKEENMIITLDTDNNSYKFKIFSVYKVDYTTDYLITDFENNTEKEKYIELITKRSLIKTDNVINIEDKILTLSTCSGVSSNNKRLVVHAVLLKE